MDTKKLYGYGNKGARLHVNFDNIFSNGWDRPTAIAGHNPDSVYAQIFDAVRAVTTETQFRYIAMRFGDRMKIREIADVEGVNPSTVSRTINRGLARCRKFIIL